jgi:acyl transferase domain-containing protein
VGALGAALSHSDDSKQPPVLVGSVKSNIGHLEGVSGLAGKYQITTTKQIFIWLTSQNTIPGVIKTVLAMENDMIPGNLHFNTPNPQIDFEGLHLAVVGKNTPWPKCNIKVRVNTTKKEIILTPYLACWSEFIWFWRSQCPCGS